MKRCTRCVLPENAPGISFDQHGVCNYCHSYKKLTYKGESALVKLLDSHRRRDSRYDCMVPVSGGRDSSFTLLKMVKDYGMKVLAIHYENPFTDPQRRHL
jgi:tRNA(Ile)-lysidine synthase TilS/MesJ